MPQTFLLVDDSATTRAFVRRIIKMAGYDQAIFVEAEDGQAALNLLAYQPVDLVIADLHMPNLDGVQMTRRMLGDEKLRHIPVLIASADPNITRLEALRAEGVRGYVRKPFTPEAFRNALNEILGAVHA